MKIGDSVRVYENDSFFIEGKILSLAYNTEDSKIFYIEVDWGDHITVYMLDELELEHRDGTWSWKPLVVGLIF